MHEHVEKFTYVCPSVKEHVWKEHVAMQVSLQWELPTGGFLMKGTEVPS